MLLGPVLLWEGGSSLTDEVGNGQNQFYYGLHGMTTHEHQPWTQMSPWPWVAAQATQTSMASVAAWPQDINTPTGVTPDPKHPHDIQW